MSSLKPNWPHSDVVEVISVSGNLHHSHTWTHLQWSSIRKVSKHRIDVIFSPTCVSWASGWARLCVQGCAGCPVGPGSSCSRWAPLEASLAPGSCRECCAWIRKHIAKENMGNSQYFMMWEKILWACTVWYIQSHSLYQRKTFSVCARAHGQEKN